MLWQRELWEHRSLWIAPLVASGLLLLILAAGALRLVNVQLGPLQLGSSVQVTTPEASVSVEPGRVIVDSDDDDAADVVVNMPGILVTDDVQDSSAAHAVPQSVVLMVITGLLLSVALFPVTGFLLESLYADRRDRSALFWRSLPVSDTATVMAKFSLVAVVLLATWLLAVPVSVLVIGLIKVSGVGAVIQLNWTVGQWLAGQLALLVFVCVGLLWYAPLAAWLMLVSAWAKRAPFAWAVAPPLVLITLESILFHSKHVLGLLGSRFMAPQPLQALQMPQLWLGLLLTAAMLWGAIALRRTADAD
jgi:ABC-2 type transport system permease protein